MMADGAQTMLAARADSATLLDLDPTSDATIGGKLSRWRWRLGVAGASLALLVAGTVSAVTVDGDSGQDLIGLLRVIGSDLLRLHWQFAIIVVLLGAAHYLAAAVAARAASGLKLRTGEAVLVQLAASAADRLTPGGVGAAAVDARYFNRRGLTLPAALGAVVSLHVLGPVTDIAVLALVIVGGSWIGLNGGGNELHALAASASHLIAPLRSPWTWLVAGTLVAAAVVWRRSRKNRPRRDWKAFWTPIRDLARHPARLATLATASGATTLILAFAFAASVAMVPGPLPSAGLGALVIAFMLGTAAGTAVPLPAGLGSTEAALIAVLVSLHVPAAAAVQQVLIFRIITFWLPAGIGVFVTHHLRRQAAL